MARIVPAPPGSLHGPTEIIPPNIVGIREAAVLLGLSEKTIRNAVKRGEIPSTLIGGRDPLRAGRGLGYRIKTEDLQAWFFGTASVEEDKA